MEIKYLKNKLFRLRGKKGMVLFRPTGSLDLGGFKKGIVVGGDEFLANEEVLFVGGSGEYERDGIEVLGVECGGGVVVYIVDIDGINVCYFEGIKELLSEKEINKIADLDADVLLFSLADEPSKNSRKVLEWARKWGISYLVPMGYENDDGVLAGFLDAVDMEGKQKEECLKIGSRMELPDGMEVVVLE
ncbi:hypothetical protein KKE45_03725 [Patescibacteria group bacterium]|nr:hypothetical protein [Patescibacteria group bacterium]